MDKENLTDSRIRKIPIPDKQIEIYDGLVKGLAVRVSPGGRKSFVYRYRFGDKVRRFTIGPYPAIGLAEGRDQARELQRMIVSGIDPLAERKQRKAKEEPLTIKDLAESFKQRHLPELRATTQQSYKSRIDGEILPVLGKIPIEKLSRATILDFLEDIAIEQENPVHANRIRAILSSMYAYGVQRGMAEFNPVLTIKPVGKEVSRKRVYTPKEIRTLWQAFEEQAEPMGTVLKMLLICAQRLGETRRMRWEDIKGDVWVIPAGQTKANRTHYLPLPLMARKAIENIRPLTGKSEFVFQSYMNKDKPVTWFGDVTRRIQTSTGIKDFRPHDLRRTAATGMAQLGVDRTVLGKTLNHKGLAGDSQVTAVYDRFEYMDEKRQALERWSLHLQQILNGKEEAKVYKL